MSRWTRLAVAALAAALAVGGLSGCAAARQRLGAAAVVDGARISTEQLQQLTRDYLRVVPTASPGDAQRDILERMLISRVIAAQARKVGVRASPGEVARERADLTASTGGTTGLIQQLAAGQPAVALPPALVDQWFTDRVLYLKIARQYVAAGGTVESQQTAARASRELVATGRAMSIEVNPRYGRWQIRTGITPLVSGGLARRANGSGAGS